MIFKMLLLWKQDCLQMIQCYFIKVKLPKNIEDTINKELTSLQNWLAANKLSINIAKSKYLIFHPKSPKFRDLGKLKISFGGSALEKVDNYKYLGITFDSKLDWKCHISNLTKKISKTVGMLYKLRHYVNKQTLIMLCHSLIYTHINYGILSWGSASKTSLYPLKVALNRLIRCVSFTCEKKVSMSPLFRQFKLLQLWDVYNLELGKLMFKYFKEQLPSNFTKIFEKLENIHQKNTRQNSHTKLHLKRTNTKKAQRSLAFAGTKFWLKLSINLKNLNSFNLFKKKLKAYLLESY